MNKITIPLSILSLLITAQVNATEHNLTSAGEVDKYITTDKLSSGLSAKKKSLSVSNATTEPQVENAITPICPTLSTGSLYTLSNSQPGESICYHFEITQRSKTTALLVGQSTETNVNLSVLKHNEDDTFTAIGTSANAGNLDEVVLALTEPGHYYWFMEVIESDGTPFNFGAAVAANLDDYEFNDTPALATVLPDKQNAIVGNMDSVNDIDYYDFTVVRGQDLSISLLDETLSDEFIFEINNNGWTPLAANNNYLFSNLQENQKLSMRVRANTALPANPNNSYKLNISSIVSSFSNHVIKGENGVTRIPYTTLNYTGPYLTTQAYNNLYWSLVLLDSSGAPIEGADAYFSFHKDVNNLTETLTVYKGTSDVNGQISEQINLPSCTPNVTGIRHTEYSLGYKNTWESDVEVGLWRIEIPTNKGFDEQGELDTIGIGGDNVPYVYFGHICDQDLISSDPS